MKRLKLDRNKMRGAQRALRYLKIERASGPHPSALSLQRRTVSVPTDSRIMRFARIERQQS